MLRALTPTRHLMKTAGSLKQPTLHIISWRGNQSFYGRRASILQTLPPRRERKDRWSGLYILLPAPVWYHKTSLQAETSQRLSPPDTAEQKIHDSGSGSGFSSWLRVLTFRKSSPSVAAVPTTGETPITIEDTVDIVAANCPVFYFHHDERYFPCTVEFFLERCQLLRVAKGWRRRVLEVLVDYGMLNGKTLAQQQEEFDHQQHQKSMKPRPREPREFLQLKLDSESRQGQPENVNKIPIYATVKETLDPLLGRRDGIEINYMKFLAYNGPYKLFHSIWVGPLGAHDADWEHVTVRLTPDGQNVVGVYYSAHRHRDGLWRSASEVPRTEGGRPIAYIAENGHGSYPVAGTIYRLFGVINDYTSSTGLKWDPERVVLVTKNSDDKLPGVVSRGDSLNGSKYTPGNSKQGRKSHVKVERQDAPWLKFQGKWGSTVESPQRQEWYVRAENPISRSWLQQIFFPLLPGVQSIYEPALEEIEEALDNLKEGMDEGMEAFKMQAEGVQKEFAESRRQAYKRWRKLVKEVRKRSSESEE